MKQFAEVSLKLMTPAAAYDARWLKKAVVCHAFTRRAAIMAGSWALETKGNR